MPSKKNKFFRNLVNLTIISSSLVGFSVLSSCNKKQNIDKVVVSTFKELKDCIEKEAFNGHYNYKEIVINEDIVVSEPIYVMNNTIITCTTSHTITRSNTFFDDMFVVGEDENGNNPILTGENAELTFKPSEGATLTIDGNASNIDLEQIIYGSSIFISNHSTVNIYGGVVIKNCRKDQSKRSINKLIPEKARKCAGGSAVCNIIGTFNMFGGKISNCKAADSDNESNAYMGGAIFNNATSNIYGGIIEDCSAFRGGAFYEYGFSNIYSCEFNNNYAYDHGGAIYLVDSQLTQINIGSDDSSIGASKVTFNSNKSVNSGGAIFVRHQACLYIIGNTIFNNNVAENGNGGAINSCGSTLINGSNFNENSSASKGGALYVYDDSTSLSPRGVEVFNCEFEQNTSKNGGAIASGANSSGEQGPTSTIKKSIFKNNTASEQGGAIYSTKGSSISIESGQFDGNQAQDKGGAIYVTNSTVILESPADSINSFSNNQSKYGGAISVHTSAELQIDNANFTNNSSTASGGAISVWSGGKVQIKKANFSENSSNKYGGALYSSGGVTEILAKQENDVIFNGNSAELQGGAIYLTGYVNSDQESFDSSLIGSFITFNANKSKKGGGALYTTAKMDSTNAAILAQSTLQLKEIIATNNSTGDDKNLANGGALYFYSSSANYIENLIIKENDCSQYGGGIYASGASTTTINYIVGEKNVASSKGGLIYITTTNTTINILGGSESGNNATEGSFIYMKVAGVKVCIKGWNESKQESPDFTYTGTIAGDGKIQKYEE